MLILHSYLQALDALLVLHDWYFFSLMFARHFISPFCILKKITKKIIINCSLSFDEDDSDSNRQHKKEESKKFIAWHTDFHHSSSTNFFLVSHLNWEKFSFLFYVIFLILLRHKKVRAHDAHNEQEIFPLTMDGVFFMLALKKRKNIEEEKKLLDNASTGWDDY